MRFLLWAGSRQSQTSRLEIIASGIRTVEAKCLASVALHMYSAHPSRPAIIARWFPHMVHQTAVSQCRGICAAWNLEQTIRRLVTLARESGRAAGIDWCCVSSSQPQTTPRIGRRMPGLRSGSRSTQASRADGRNLVSLPPPLYKQSILFAIPDDAMPEITFVFGPNNTFFFDCPKTWKL